MKSLCIVILAILTWPTFAQKDMEKAFAGGNADLLAQYIGQDLELSIFDREGIYSKGRAIQELKTFFSQYKPEGYTTIHVGTSKDQASYYSIGNLETSQGIFRVYLYYDGRSQKTLVKELRIDKQ